MTKATEWRKLTPVKRTLLDQTRDLINNFCSALKTKYPEIQELKIMKSKEFWEGWQPNHKFAGMLLRWTKKADRYIGVVSVKHNYKEFNFSWGSPDRPFGALRETLGVALANIKLDGVPLIIQDCIDSLEKLRDTDEYKSLLDKLDKLP
jgi:hypothetical protein